MARMNLPSFRSSITTFIALAALLQTTTAAVNDFSYYPSGAQSCLQSATTSSKCDQSTVAKFNACVCGNGGNFIDDSAKCIGKNSPSDLTTTYTVLQRNCADSNTPLNNYSLDKFLAAGSATTAAGTATTRTSTSLVTITQSGSTRVSTSLAVQTTSVAPSAVVSTITVATTDSAGRTTGVLSVVTFAPLQSVTSPPSSSSPAAASSTGSSGLSTGAAVGIGVGVGVPVVLALCALVGVLIWRGKKKDRAAAAAGAGTGDGPEKAYAHEIDGSSSVVHSQSHSPYAPSYAQPVGAAAAGSDTPYKQSPHTPAATYDPALPAYTQGHGQPLPPVELSGTPLYPEPQELPGSYQHPHR